MLQKALELVASNASYSAALPLTHLVNLKVSNNQLTLSTINSTTTMFVTIPIQSNDFEIAVELKPLLAFIKATTNDVTIKEVNDKLKVKGNGTATFAPIITATNEIATIPDCRNDFDLNIPLNNISNNFAVCTKKLLKSCATDIDVYSNLYFGNNTAIGTDISFAAMQTMLTFDQPELLTPALVKTLGKLPSNLQYTKLDSKHLYFKAEEEGYLIELIHSLTDNVQQYQFDALNGLFSAPYSNWLTVDVVNVKEALKRYNAIEPSAISITLKFTPDSLIIETDKFIEKIPITSNLQSEYVASYSLQKFKYYIGLFKDMLTIKFDDTPKMLLLSENELQCLVSSWSM